jgi:hypothetical protein
VLKDKRGNGWECVVLLTGKERRQRNQVLKVNTYNNLKHDAAKGGDILWEIENRLEDKIKVDLMDEIMKM